MEKYREVKATRIEKVFYRGDIVDWGEGYGTCPSCGGQFYANGVIGVADSVFHCHGQIAFKMER